MSRRLSCIFSMIRPGVGVIDVGTDHGYLPEMLAKSGYSGQILASDIREGPLDAARRTAQNAGLSDRIRFLLCDGLDDCPPDAVDTIVIAGMGGDTICGILDRAEWCMSEDYRLILQPMSKAEVLRYWLVHNGFSIEEEALAEENGTIYQILGARFCGVNQKLTDAELYIGSRGLADPALYQKLLGFEIRRVERRIEGLSAGAEGYELAFQRSRLKELKEMEAGL